MIGCSAQTSGVWGTLVLLLLLQGGSYPASSNLRVCHTSLIQLGLQL